MTRERSPRVLATALACLMASTAGRAAEWTRIAEPRAILYYEDGALAPAAADRFARLLDRGVADVARYLGASSPEALRRPPIVFRVGESLSYSMTRGRTVWLMPERVRTDSAPYLHETVHALLPAPNRSTWLSEGFASYVESHVAENIGGYEAHVFSRGGNPGVDGEAARWLTREAGRSVEPYVGRPGAPPDMESARRRVAAPFYVLSQSFAKFLVDRVGLPRVIGLVASRDPEAELARRTGRGVDEWKTDWLRQIAAEGAAGQGRASR